jgi:hypothetical protein
VRGAVDEIQAGQVKVRLQYVLKAKADPLIASLAATGFPADGLVVGSALNHSVALPTTKWTRLRKARRIDGALAVAALSLALLLGSFRVMVLSQRLEEAEILLRSELVQFRQTAALQAAYASFAARRAAVPERRAQEVGAYELLLALAQHLPNGTLIRTLEFDRGRARVDLSNADSDSTLKALRVVPIIRNPKIEPSLEPLSIAATFELARKSP